MAGSQTPDHQRNFVERCKGTHFDPLFNAPLVIILSTPPTMWFPWQNGCESQSGCIPKFSLLRAICLIKSCPSSFKTLEVYWSWTLLLHQHPLPTTGGQSLRCYRNPLPPIAHVFFLGHLLQFPNLPKLAFFFCFYKAILSSRSIKKSVQTWSGEDEGCWILQPALWIPICPN